MKHFEVIKLRCRPVYVPSSGYFRVKLNVRSCSSGSLFELSGHSDLSPLFLSAPKTIVCIQQWIKTGAKVEASNCKINVVPNKQQLSRFLQQCDVEQDVLKKFFKTGAWSKLLDKEIPEDIIPEQWFSVVKQLFPYMKYTKHPDKFIEPVGIHLLSELERIGLFWGHYDVLKIIEHEEIGYRYDNNERLLMTRTIWYKDFDTLKREPFVLLDINGFGIKRVTDFINALPDITDFTRNELRSMTHILDQQDASGSIYVSPPRDLPDSLRFHVNEHTSFVCIASQRETEKRFVQVLRGYSEVDPFVDYELDPVLNDLQREAVMNVMTNWCSLVRGPPGTGKTRVVKSIAKQLANKNVVLLAPTGKAVYRMRETLSDLENVHVDYFTIHKASFKNFDDLGHSLIFVIDESSMLDLSHVSILTYIIGKTQNLDRIVFLGDTNQLPPVGSGDMFRDLILSERFPTVTLQERFRVLNADTGLMRAIMDVEKGQVPVSSSDGSFVHKKLAKESDIDEYFLRCLSEFDYNDFKEGRVMVICGLCRQVNKYSDIVRNYLLPETKCALVEDFVDGELVVCNQNMYDDYGVLLRGTPGVVNGLNVLFEDGHEMSLKDLKGKTNDKSNLLRNYATTAHKSQGSEAQTVVFLVEPWECPRLHYRNLFYTAMTRAKNKCIVIGPDDVFQKMIKREPIKRLTSVREHF